MKVLLAEAFSIKADQILGPGWLDGGRMLADCFTVLAKMPDGATSTQLRPMLQNLLAERFKLRFHKETRGRPSYLLTVDKGGSKLRQTDPDAPGVGARVGQVAFGFTTPLIKGSMTLAVVFRLLSQRLGSPIQDSTDLNGTYDIDLTWTADQPGEALPGGAAADPGASVFTAIRESLGLKLEPRKLPVEMLIIDHIDRTPSAN